MTNTHDLKTWPTYFAAVWEGRKPFEIRWDDRGYQVGDIVVLREFDNQAACRCFDTRHPDPEACARFTGRTVTATIGYVAASTPPKGRQPGFRGDGYVVLSLIDITRGGVGKGPGPQDRSQAPSDTPSPVPDGVASPQPGASPAATSLTAQAVTPGVFATGGVVTPASLAAARRRSRSRAVLERRGDEHIPVAAPRVAYSSGGDA